MKKFFYFSIFLLFAAGGIYGFLSPEPMDSIHPKEIAASSGKPENTAKTDSIPPAPEPTPLVTVKKGVVKSGDSAARILSPWLTSAKIQRLADTTKPVFALNRIRIGNPYKIIAKEDTFTRFEYTVNSDTYLVIEATETGFTAKLAPIAYEIQMATVRGVVEKSLYQAFPDAKDRPLAVRLGNLFGWEIDFAKDIRTGDSFSVLVEKRFSNDRFCGYGKILAAQFVNKGTLHDAYRMENTDGSASYYSAEGKNLRHAFLKTPVAFTRISSGFTHRRYHPVLNCYKPHYGVDYAAPTGTPIYAIGNGTIRRVATNSRSGNHILITHNNGYESGYLHMSRFARKIRSGQKVEQGQLIGYVGSTGLATGPHLCFRMKRHGRPVDPTKIDVPRAADLPPEQKQEFTACVRKLRPQLHLRYAATDAHNLTP